jgi:hypothetical protein
VSALGKPRSKVLPFPKKVIAQTPPSKSTIDVSASFGQREPALAGDDLQQAVRRIVLYGTFRESRHSAKDRSYRNISEGDIVAMLEGTWSLVAPPEWDNDHHNWKYTLAGSDIDGDDLVLVVAVIVELDRIEIITKYWRAPWRNKKRRP